MGGYLPNQARRNPRDLANNERVRQVKLWQLEALLNGLVSSTNNLSLVIMEERNHVRLVARSQMPGTFAHTTISLNVS